MSRTRLSLTLLCAGLSLTACGRVADVGRVPAMTAPHDSAEFQAMAEPVLTVPPGDARPDGAASLWEGKQLSLVGDRRAGTRGDILTVVIEIDD
ncbi:MAG TPA: flagellar basal body L-ring protein FlgH, partial [Paracoccus sp. (in: a-proteobacteria)]|nr:flagellar basal body L-ring protein FlgH [Paracoccus sp. (in: a-proteobacteria)]